PAFMVWESIDKQARLEDRTTSPMLKLATF
uniref:DUF3291 domain-containing protein n=1 Tax=Haemonchus contortus TaxID=6289 RepID=A0A7I4YJC7_HAECO